MTNKIKVVELFAGVGGFRIGLEGWNSTSATSSYTKKLLMRLRSSFHLHFISLLFTFFCLTLSKAMAQKKEVIFVDPDTSTLLHWGAITVPLVYTSVKVPTGKRAELKPVQPTTITINELLISLKERIFLYKNEQLKSNFKTISLIFSPSYQTVQKLVKRGIPAKEAQGELHKKRYTLKLAENEPKKLTETAIQKIRSIIEHDTRITIMVNKNDFIGAVIVKADYAPYEPPAIVKHTKLELFNFQLLEPIKGATILRVDTQQNKRIFNAYKSDQKTRIIHIPNFQTATRTVAESDEINLEKVFRQASSYPIGEALYFREYVDYQPTDLKMIFGELVANPESQNYSLGHFQENKGKLILQHNKEILKIKSIRLTIFDKLGKPQSHFIKIFKKNKWQQYLSNVSYENSIYFDKIMIEKNKQPHYLGQAFVFKIGKSFLEK